MNFSFVRADCFRRAQTLARTARSYHRHIPHLSIATNNHNKIQHDTEQDTTDKLSHACTYLHSYRLHDNSAGRQLYLPFSPRKIEPKIFPYQAKACQSSKAKSPDSPVDSSPNRKHHPVITTSRPPRSARFAVVCKFR